EPQALVWSAYFAGALAYNAIFATALAWLLWLYALDRLPAGIAGMGTLAVPMVGISSAWLQLGERPAPAEAAGMALIFVGLAVLAWGQLRTRHPLELPPQE
ncbi:MAG: EamA family transporter, partial [Gammaproteobacteria bacterium]